jgi:hypothetical protein
VFESARDLGTVTCSCYYFFLFSEFFLFNESLAVKYNTTGHIFFCIIMFMFISS